MAIDKALIQNSKLLKNLSPEALEKLEALLVKKELPAGEVIFREGTSGDVMYFIESGSIKITKTVEGDVQTPLAVLSPGQCFGEMSLIDNTARSASARSVEPTVVHCLSRDDFNVFLEKEPEATARFLMGILAEVNGRLRHTDEVLRDTIYWGMRTGGHLDIAKD